MLNIYSSLLFRILFCFIDYIFTFVSNRKDGQRWSHSRTTTIWMQICHATVLNYFQQLASNVQQEEYSYISPILYNVNLHWFHKTDSRVSFELVSSVLYATNITRLFQVQPTFYKLRLETTFDSSVLLLWYVVTREEVVPKMK